MGTLSGSCNCGTITVVIPIPLAKSLILCHCTSCRKSSGTLAAHNLGVDKQDFQLEGEPKEFVEVGLTGGNMWRYFCPKCGSDIYDRDTIDPDTRWVKAGLFPPGTVPRPKLQIFTKNFEEWETPYPGTTCRETQLQQKKAQ